MNNSFLPDYLSGNISGPKDTFKQVNCMRNGRRKVLYRNQTSVERKRSWRVVRPDLKIVSTLLTHPSHPILNQKTPSTRTSDEAPKGSRAIHSRVLRVLI